jgi:ubiquinone/menaquinone biosynthesis C-methylase UbiE
VIEFKDGEAEIISLPTSTVDAILCRWELLFLPVSRAGLSNIYRSLAEGGREATAVCASLEEVPFLSVVMNTVRKLISHKMNHSSSLIVLLEKYGYSRIQVL